MILLMHRIYNAAGFPGHVPARRLPLNIIRKNIKNYIYQIDIQIFELTGCCRAIVLLCLMRNDDALDLDRMDYSFE